jgi:uncharacterized protein
MAYTEIKSRNKKKYYYRVISVRNNNKVSKKRIYLGVNLTKKNLLVKENQADYKLKGVMRKPGLEKIKPRIIKILKKNKIKKAGIFGSYVRGEERKDSDIDILIEPPKGMSLFGLSGLKIELEDDLKKKVDLVTYKYIHPYLKERILDSEVRII